MHLLLMIKLKKFLITKIAFDAFQIYDDNNNFSSFFKRMHYFLIFHNFIFNQNFYFFILNKITKYKTNK